MIAKPNKEVIKLKKYNCPFSLTAGKKRINILGIPNEEKAEIRIA